MAINFPNTPSTNDVYTISGYSWRYDGSKWVALEQRQPLDENLFSITSNKPSGYYLTNDGTNVYWQDVWTTVSSNVTSQINTTFASYTNLTTNAQSGTSYTLTLADANDLIEMSSSSSNTVVIPLNSVVTFPVGTQITILSTGTGTTTVTVSVGVTLNCTPQSTANTATLRAQWSSVQLIKRATDIWVALGDLV